MSIEVVVYCLVVVVFSMASFNVGKITAYSQCHRLIDEALREDEEEFIDRLERDYGLIPINKKE